MQKSFSDLEYAAKKKLTRRDVSLTMIDGVTPWSQLHALIEPFYPKVEGAGRPPIGMARMLRMYVAQQCFGLSDEGTEDAIYDSQAIRGFVKTGGSASHRGGRRSRLKPSLASIRAAGILLGVVVGPLNFLSDEGISGYLPAHCPV